MTNDMLQVIREEGARRYPAEACGVVIRKGKKSLAIPCENISSNPTMFIVNPDDYLAAVRQGEVIGVWHTHPEASPQPSEADRVGCENSELPWYIVGVYRQADGTLSFSDMVTLEPNGFELPYLERPYAFGVLDCWSLVRDYYRREFGIKLGDYPRIEKFWLKGHDFFGDGWAKEGFVQLINDEAPQRGDLFIMQTESSGAPNHIGVFVGDDLMLHHAHGRLSRHDIYGGYWHKHTIYHIRHRSML